MIMVYLQDFQSPVYKARRVARGGGDFTMLKIRSMVMNAEQLGPNSTGESDSRITWVGHFIRRYKIDELSQFINVVAGTMSIVGPRPNVRKWGVDLYTELEKTLLNVKPGITDLSSIIFSDEGEILEGAQNADEVYNQLIRPWKSHLGLIYNRHMCLSLDMKIILLTALSVFHKDLARKGVIKILKNLNASPELIRICHRDQPLAPALPPETI